MSLKATLTMLMSMTDISAPSIAAMVIRVLLPWIGVCSSMGVASGTLDAGSHGDGGAHPRPERDHRGLVEPDEHRHALHDLHEVPARVIGREESETSAGSAGQALHATGELAPAEGIDPHRGLLAGLHLADLVLLEVGNHPDVLERHQRHHRPVGRDELALLDGAAADDAVHRRAHLGVAAVERGEVVRGLRLIETGLCRAAGCRAPAPPPRRAAAAPPGRAAGPGRAGRVPEPATRGAGMML